VITWGRRVMRCQVMRMRVAMRLQRTMIKGTLVTVSVLLAWVFGASAAYAQLGQLIRLAASESPAVAKAQRELDLARSHVAEAQADLGWRLAVATLRSASVQRGPAGESAADVRITADVTRSVTPNQSLALSLDEVTVGLDNGAKTVKAGPLTLGWAVRVPDGAMRQEAQLVRERARAVEQKELALELAREAAVVAVAKAFLDYWKVDLDQQVAHRQLDIYSLQLQKSKALAEVGRATATEIRVAEQRVRVAELDIVASSAQREAAGGELSRQLGVDKEMLLAVAQTWLEPTWQPEGIGSCEELLGRAEQRPEVRQALLSKRISEENLAAGRLGQPYELKPLVSYDMSNGAFGLGLDMTKVKDGTTGSLSASLRVEQSGQWSMHASFATSLGGADSAISRAVAIRNAEAELRVAQSNLLQARDDAHDKIRTSWADVAAKAARYDLQLALLERELLNYTTVQARTELGGATLADVAEAQFAYVQAEAAAHRALYDWQLAYVRLLAAVGDYEVLGQLEG
jgi:outer membrane protein TolC